ncbi:MAG: sugar ABC transporter permease [Trueperaceae bacterium]
MHVDDGIDKASRTGRAARPLARVSLKRHRESLSALLFLLPAGIILFTFQFLPAVDVFRLSLTDRLLIRPFSNFVGLDNYQRLMTDGRFWNSVGNTFYFVLASVPLQIALALSLALGLAGKVRAVGFFRTTFFLPVVASMVAVSVVWEWLYHPSVGLFNAVIELAGGTPVQWLQSSQWAMPAIIILIVWKGTGYYMVIYLAGLMDIPKQYYEAAHIDGARKWDLFRYITWPMLAPTSYLVLVLQVINSFQVFAVVYVMTGGGPVRSTEVVVFYLYQRAFESFEFGYASAISVAMFLFLVTATILQRVFIGSKVSYER